MSNVTHTMDTGRAQIHQEFNIELEIQAISCQLHV